MEKRRQAENMTSQRTECQSKRRTKGREREKSQGQGGEAESKGPRTQGSPGSLLPSLPIPQV